MNININCTVSLSKKLRALIGDNETTLTLVTGQLNDGKGQANIMLTLDNVNEAELAELINKETSIQLTPIELVENIPQGQSVTNLFASSASFDSPNAFTRKIGTVSAPKNREDRRYAIKTQKEITEEVPEMFEETKNPKFQEYIADFDQLMNAVKLAQSKDYGIDIDSIQDSRKKAIAMEEKERAESIDNPAYIVNDKYASLTLNDLDIQLVLNSPYNLANISAKRLAASKELKAMINAGSIKFINPADVASYMFKAASDTSMGLEVFGGERGTAKKAAKEVDSSSDDEFDLDLGTTDEATEQEKLLKATKVGEARMISTDTRDRVSDGTRISRHGNGAPETKRQPTQMVKDNKTPSLKTIRRSGIEFN
jgi:hypothetical protein